MGYINFGEYIGGTEYLMGIKLIIIYKNVQTYYVIQIINNTNTTDEYKLYCHFWQYTTIGNSTIKIRAKIAHGETFIFNVVILETCELL